MNVILIILDSLREDCIGYFGEPPWGKVSTPNLDRFAEESFVIKRCYPESLPTLPARIALYTGQRVFPVKEKNKYKSDFYFAPGWGPIPEDNETLSEILQKNGYTTALISDIQYMFSPSKNFHRGFDEWVWIRGYEVDQFRSGPTPKKGEINYWLPRELRDYGYEDGYEAFKIYTKYLSQCLMNIKDFRKEEDYFVAKVMREATRWLEQNREKEKFFLLIESWSPHEPFFVPKYYRDMYCDKDLHQNVLSIYQDASNLSPETLKVTQANYSGLVTMVDRWVGYLINNISNMGLLDDTLIIVTTDHGHSIGDNNYMGKRGYPSSPEVFNIPILLRLPDCLRYKRCESNILVQHTDIPATILDIIGVKAKRGDFSEWIPINNEESYEEVEKEIKMHGKSFFKALKENKSEFRDHVTIGWGSAVTVIKDNWWFNCKVNGKGVFLYDLGNKDAFKKNVAEDNSNIVERLFNLALKDAKGKFPDYLIELASNELDAPGCSEFALLGGK